MKCDIPYKKYNILSKTKYIQRKDEVSDLKAVL